MRPGTKERALADTCQLPACCGAVRLSGYRHKLRNLAKQVSSVANKVACGFDPDGTGNW